MLWDCILGNIIGENFAIGDLHYSVILLQLPAFFANSLSYCPTKESKQSILVVVVYDAIMQIAYWIHWILEFSGIKVWERNFWPWMLSGPWPLVWQLCQTCTFTALKKSESHLSRLWVYQILHLILPGCWYCSNTSSCTVFSATCQK